MSAVLLEIEDNKMQFVMELLHHFSFVNAHPVSEKKEQHSIALNKLCGMFKNTNLLSSDEFAKNKENEKRLEEDKLEL
jgi:hypothetical protein